MKLLIEELRNTLSQEFTISLNKRRQVYAVRPRLYMHNAPSGTFTVKIKDGATELASRDFTSTELKSLLNTANNYAHGFFKLDFDEPVPLKNGTYQVELSASGYTFSESAYLAWVKDHDNVFHEIDGTVDGDEDKPLTFELWTYRNEVRA